MKVTKIKSNGKKVSLSELETLCQYIVFKASAAGFITESSVVNSQSIKIGLHMRTFKIDVNQLGYNAQYNPYRQTKLGYVRTCTPTWEQRVEFNNIVNEAFDRFKLTANIKSGDYTIRKGFYSYTEDDWFDQIPDWQENNEARGFIVKAL